MEEGAGRARMRYFLRRLVAPAAILALMVPTIAGLEMAHNHLTPVFKTPPSVPPTTETTVQTPVMAQSFGEVLHRPGVVLIYQGGYWKSETGARQSQELTQWMAGLSDSKYLQVLTGYSDAKGPASSHLDVASAYDSTDPSPRTPFTDTQAEVQKLKPSLLGLLPPGDDVIYMVILPPEVALTDPMAGGDGTACGEHGSYGVLSDSGAVIATLTAAVQWCGEEDVLTEAEWHEILETVTDPWATAYQPEVGDVCEKGPQPSIGGHRVAAIYDPTSGRCQTQADIT